MAMAPERALTPHVDGFSDAQISILKRHIAPGIPNDELAYFGAICQRTGLDPLTKQIYCIERGGKWTVQTGIDGYRLLAARTGELAGIDDAIYDTEEAEHPGKATVNVYRLVNGYVARFSATARWGEYVQTTRDGKPANMWARMPYLMLGKCAESLALRKAFPAELSGLYTSDEMAQADNEPPHVPHISQAQTQAHHTPPVVRPMTPSQPSPVSTRSQNLGSLRLRLKTLTAPAPLTTEKWEHFLKQQVGTADAKRIGADELEILDNLIAGMESERQAEHELGITYTDDPGAPIGTSSAADDAGDLSHLHAAHGAH